MSSGLRSSDLRSSGLRSSGFKSSEYEHGECHHDLNHKGASILMTESDDEPIVEETLVESVHETARKPDSSSKYLESFTSDLLIVDDAGGFLAKKALWNCLDSGQTRFGQNSKSNIMTTQVQQCKSRYHSRVETTITIASSFPHDARNAHTTVGGCSSGSSLTSCNAKGNTWFLEVGDLILITDGPKVKMKHEAVKAKQKMLAKIWWKLLECFGVGLGIRMNVLELVFYSDANLRIQSLSKLILQGQNAREDYEDVYGKLQLRTKPPKDYKDHSISITRSDGLHKKE
ncbi:hypothetical protein Bca4012_026480 [Brassica carinata]